MIFSESLLNGLKVHMKLLFPPHNGFGGDEDSLGSCLNLRPKPPRKDLVPVEAGYGLKAVRYVNHVITFLYVRAPKLVCSDCRGSISGVLMSKPL